MSRKALITGIEGFTGRYLTTELRDAGYDVYGLANAGFEGLISGVAAIHRCDLRDANGVSKVVSEVRPDKVVHLAGIAFVGHGDPEEIYRTNLLGSRNLLVALGRGPTQPDSVLLASSANVYGNASIPVIDENTAPAPANDYAVSKLAMELVARLWLDRLPITIVRPFNYTGVGQSEEFLIPKIVGHFRRRLPRLELGNLDVVREYSDVRSVVRCYHRLLEAPGVSGEVFNVCSGTGHSLNEVLATMRELSGFAPEIQVNPALVRANEVRKLVGSRAKMIERLGPIADIPLGETLRWMYEAG
jgi:nucleoside-diphosphate-sugar epimerase